MFAAGLGSSRGIIDLGLGATKKRKPQASMTIQALQIALQLLGSKGDGILSAVKADGFIGTKTVAAVNRAMRLYVTSAPAAYRSGHLTTTQVVANAVDLARLIVNEARRRGVPEATIQAAIRAKGMAPPTARPSALPPGARPVAATPPTPPARVVKTPAIRQLQSAIRGLGQRVNDRSLVIAADGLIGSKTVAAANRAMSVYVTAPAVYKTGALSRDQVFAMAATLTPYIVAETSKRGAAAHAAASPASGSHPAVVSSARRASNRTLQEAIASLGTTVKDPALNIVADGVVGSKTVRAANRAFMVYVTSAPAKWRTGALTTAVVVRDAAGMADAINREAVRRAGQQGTADQAAAADATGQEEGGAAATTPAAADQTPAAGDQTPAAADQTPAEAASASTAAQAALPQNASATAPPGTPASATNTQPSGDEGGGSDAPTQTTPAADDAGGGWWAGLSTPAKVAVGAGGAVVTTGIIWALAKAFGGGGARAAQYLPRRRYA